MSYRKRKHRQRSVTRNSQQDYPDGPSPAHPDPTLFIVAHEADIIRGPHAARTADSLEVGLNVDGKGGTRIGEGLIKWESHIGGGEDGEEGEMWVDRYDARLLLDALPTINAAAAALARPDSPSGWSDLPSDAEDTFFLTPTETADLHRTKRLRHLDALRTARLRALSPDTDPAPLLGSADPWGDSDEEPDEAQIELMRRTATYVTRATNSAQLRARILAHHGADPRIAAWARAQADARREILVEREEAQAQSVGALGGLTGYGSASESENEDDGENISGQEAQKAEAEEVAERAAQEARRAKAREWAEKRRAGKALATVDKDDQWTDMTFN
ncbi:hypothetical protein B0F90DRAFT_1810905 [Multifurca ochricompacta]|uniref:Uncharacterized protein n=1 Tax=Multifurca ochricompacta TaxID=376703 RepID=A0AAD4QM87_9AGAM|nr:hypothetical protein B0F90DRAFT_1810905 [Multifurca ochricompacta]